MGACRTLQQTAGLVLLLLSWSPPGHVHTLRLCDRGQATVVHLLYGLEAGEASCNEFVVLEHGSYLAFDTVAGVSSRLTVNQLG